MPKKPITEVTVRWSLSRDEGLIPAPQRRRILAALKDGDLLAMDLIKDAIVELNKLYEEGGYTMESDN